MNLEQLKYPIGTFKAPNAYTPQLINGFLTDIEAFPARLRAEISGLSDQQLDTPYRPGGWTLRQLVHHCADSHANSLVRFKLALTEENPTIKPYFEDRWAELFDSTNMPVEPALQMLEGIHARWVYLLKSLGFDDYKRAFLHPETGSAFSLGKATALYAWHSNHHLAHVVNLKKKKGWICFF